MPQYHRKEQPVKTRRAPLSAFAFCLLAGVLTVGCLSADNPASGTDAGPRYGDATAGSVDH